MWRNHQYSDIQAWNSASVIGRGAALREMGGWSGLRRGSGEGMPIR